MKPAPLTRLLSVCSTFNNPLMSNNVMFQGRKGLVFPVDRGVYLSYLIPIAEQLEEDTTHNDK